MYSYLIKLAFFILVFSISSLTAQNSITGNTGTGNVTLTINNNQTITSDASGNYSIPFSGSFDGTVVPTKVGYTFTPTQRSYVESGSRTNQDFTAKKSTYSIIGNAGTGGVTLSWVVGRETKTTTSKANGDYNVAVFHGWSGTVTPSKNKYTFTPSNKSYTNVVANNPNENYSAFKNFTISGNTGIGNVTLSYNHGGTQTITSDPSGNYSITFSSEFNGNVIPTKVGYIFTPAHRSYIELLSDIVNQDYTATLDSYTISGNTGTGDVTLTWENGGTQTTTSDGSGNYSITIPSGWNGTVTPSKDGYNFSPESRGYIEVGSNIENQDYTASQNWYSISGNTGTGEVTLTWDNGGVENTTSDSSGNYSISIPSGWNGTVTPTKDGYTFNPENKGYVEVGSDLENQDYVANALQYIITAVANPEVGGTIDSLKPGGEYNNGETVLIIAIPNTGYKFVNWTLSGKEVSTDSSYTFIAIANADYVANFELAELVIDCSANPSDAGTTSGCGTFQLNDEITITAEANSDWVFTYWTEDGDTVSNNAEYTFTVLKSRNLIANFDLISGIEKIGSSEIIPQNYYLSNAYPNPFNPETTIKFGIPEESNVSLIIFDITGQIIETALVNTVVHAGNYANHFYADNLPSGIYLYLLRANSTTSERNFKKTGKVLLIK